MSFDFLTRYIAFEGPSYESFGIVTAGRFDFFFQIRNYDSEGNPGAPFGKICGNHIPPTIISANNVLHVKFHSNSAIARSGFKAHYELLGSYGKHINCIYKVIQKNQQLRLKSAIFHVMS